MKKATLNAENRARFADAILADAFEKRFEVLRGQMAELMPKLYERTWGKTPQARAALKKKVTAFNKMRRELRNKDVEDVSGNSAGREKVYGFFLSAGGQRFKISANPNEHGLGNSFDLVYLRGNNGSRDYWAANDELSLPADDPLVKQFHAIKDEWDETSSACRQLRAQIMATLNTCRTFDKALEKWPGVAAYAEAILSRSREVAVRGEVLDARIAALKAGKVPATKALKIGAEQ